MSAALDRAIENTRDTILGCAGAGWVGCVVIGFKAGNAGVQVVGSNLMDQLTTIGALECAKHDVIEAMRARSRGASN